MKCIKMRMVNVRDAVRFVNVAGSSGAKQAVWKDCFIPLTFTTNDMTSRLCKISFRGFSARHILLDGSLMSLNDSRKNDELSCFS